MKTRHSKQVLVGLSVFSDGVLHFLQIKKKFYLFYQNYLVALIWRIDICDPQCNVRRAGRHTLLTVCGDPWREQGRMTTLWSGLSYLAQRWGWRHGAEYKPGINNRWVSPWGWVNFCDIPEPRNCFSFSQVTLINNDFSLKRITNYVRSSLAAWNIKITDVEVCSNVI